MLKEFLWETFQRTGDIQAYIAYKEIEDRENSIEPEEVLCPDPVSVG
jgi:hypothetical protein